MPQRTDTVQEKYVAKTDNYYKLPDSHMKLVILITGTPCIGKTTTAKQLAEKINAQYINLTEYAKTNNLTLQEDTVRKTEIINEEEMRLNLSQTIDSSMYSNIIIDGHYAAAVTPSGQTTYTFVLRKNPKELKKQMLECGFQDQKLWENLGAEILDVCLIEALQAHAGKVCEIDTTAKTVEEVTSEIIAVLEEKKPCYNGIIDWLGMLEREGITDQYLKA